MYTQTKGLMAVKDGRVWEYTDDVTGGNWSEQAHNVDFIYVSSELTVSLSLRVVLGESDRKLWMVAGRLAMSARERTCMKVIKNISETQWPKFFSLFQTDFYQCEWYQITIFFFKVTHFFFFADC